MHIIPYLFFPGTCNEAIHFYEKALNGKVNGIMTYGESPDATSVPPEMHEKVMNSQLTFDGGSLMASDAAPDRYSKPAGLSVTLAVDTPEKADELFSTLSEGGEVQMPSGETFWALRFSMFTDRFGTPWMINCDRPHTA